MNVNISVEDIRPGQGPERPVVNVEQRMNKILRSYVAALECCNNIPTSNNIFNSIMVRSLADLNMMRMSLDGDMYHSAGVPWYDTLFGRDSIISALQLLPFEAGVAKSTLLVNAKYQGRKTNDWRDEEPGKMLHELRTGELANLNLIPQTPYYGTVDATPLFLMLLSEYVNWTGDMELLKQLESNVDAALKWIDVYADIDKRGFTSLCGEIQLGNIQPGLEGLVRLDQPLRRHAGEKADSAGRSTGLRVHGEKAPGTVVQAAGPGTGCGQAGKRGGEPERAGSTGGSGWRIRNISPRPWTQTASAT